MGETKYIDNKDKVPHNLVRDELYQEGRCVWCLAKLRHKGLFCNDNEDRFGKEHFLASGAIKSVCQIDANRQQKMIEDLMQEVKLEEA